ncbi:hypothetical protein LGV61_07695 [Desulfurispirillum indicum]|uniref:Uncharacterized protein n=1 Tax=Desulfurispirillum indicum (strain ATCC BAA-1389 / DSM 22839 / S5) TaxID=653733 RepID=E6W7B5_DESIS|nr:hypothetical protein [Desulfurispirillum indicum]ADU66282.1 hypothetical protein Selin_1549 [Desulfurispirillum indicum S5]UCZ55613.1 hypothetical protein LGV61_07695 [Desulfurispirillum indicum]
MDNKEVMLQHAYRFCQSIQNSIEEDIEREAQTANSPPDHWSEERIKWELEYRRQLNRRYSLLRQAQDYNWDDALRYYLRYRKR